MLLGSWAARLTPLPHARPNVQYEYAMHGKLYKWKQDQPKAPVEVYISFGGLLMRLRGDARHLVKLSLDSRLYLLIRKIVS